MTIISHERAIKRAESWLNGLRPSTREARALRRLGLLCCKHLASGVGLGGRGRSTVLRLPAVGVFVTLGRDRTLALCRSISLASLRARQMGAKKRKTWSEMFGSVALSYARVGDPSTTAVLLRASAQLGLTHPWLVEAERYLLDQQTPEGSFGLFARELTLVGSHEPLWMAHLNLSVEVLWALAEVTALNQSHAAGRQARAPRFTRARAPGSLAVRERSEKQPVSQCDH